MTLMGHRRGIFGSSYQRLIQGKEKIAVQREIQEQTNDLGHGDVDK